MATRKRVGFGLRLVAWLIDGVVLSVIWSLIARMPFLPFGKEGWESLNLLVGALYSILFWVHWNGKTAGKKIMKIKVVTEKGKGLDYQTAVIRYLGYLLSAIVLLLGYLWVIWDDKKQAWHDKLAKTYVVRE